MIDTNKQFNINQQKQSEEFKFIKINFDNFIDNNLTKLIYFLRASKAPAYLAVDSQGNLKIVLYSDIMENISILNSELDVLVANNLDASKLYSNKDFKLLTDTFGYWQINNNLLEISKYFGAQQIATQLLSRYQRHLKRCLKYQKSLGFSHLSLVETKDCLFTAKSYIEYLTNHFTEIESEDIASYLVIEHFEYFLNMLMTVNDFKSLTQDSIFLSKVLIIMAIYWSVNKSNAKINMPAMQILINELKKHENALTINEGYLFETKDFAKKVGLTKVVRRCEITLNNCLKTMVNNVTFE